ncbi:microsomal triglyceride transfer protein large subunit [Harmonia axyridis]|uniref:microsomal triglyceride transfer protein large subunit n=1 Tax=Harmonia axyridis TaxID=115357 RepID=UPI001E278181|nr:microsomal triglyceride transfer protein large subunit [Harmonia axyridis]XP_045476216.1 microsomal triglyceride transfer protein large subunit [Harmonia axyridis]
MFKLSSSTIFYVLLVWILGSCYGFVLLSSAAGQNGDVKLFVPGEETVYNLHSTVVLNEKDEESKNVGYIVAGKVSVKVVWGKENQKILKIQLDEPKLHIKSRKAPSPDGFVFHTSRLQEFTNKPFYVHWNNGKITKILVNAKEPASLVNLKKGTASLFQFQLLDGSYQETDASGTCTAEYTSKELRKIAKTKKDCISPDLPYVRNPELSLDTIVNSSRHVDYELDPTYQYFQTIRSQETHVMSVSTDREFGNQVHSEVFLEFVKNSQGEVSVLQGKTAHDVLASLISSENLSEESLKTDKEASQNEDTRSFSEAVNELRDQLAADLIGTAGTARTFLKLVSIARNAPKKEIEKTLNSKKNKLIIPQLMDILGSSKTTASYEAVMNYLDFTKEEQLDENERYLWGLSLGSDPNPDVLEKLFVKYKKSENIPTKLNKTLLLTIASISRKLKVNPKNLEDKTSQKFEKLVLEKLRAAKDEESYPYLRALKNLQSPSTIPDLLKKIRQGSTKEGALAWKALISFDKKHWTPEVQKAARKTFLQLDRKHDSSSRSIASEILLESKPTDSTLKEIINHLASNDTAYEIKQYALQKIRMLSEDDPELKRRVLETIKADRKINNYSVLNPRGLSTAIKRYFVKNQSGNGSLISLQEINNAIVKRGVVNIVWEKDGRASELFSLGIFTSGLASFRSSKTEETDDEPESTTAGMELAVFGTQLRPFVFFSSQGELMGHVWSGTASERTTAYQALMMLQDHLEYLRLGSGFIVELDLRGAISFDLAGKIEISIWGRTADSVVEKNAGIFLTGSMKIDTGFVRSQVEFTTSLEPQLKLESDIDFSANMRCCLRLSQVDVLFKHNIYKIERIPGSKHKLRIAKSRKFLVPGKTYSLNRKNNEMCSAIHQ